MTPIPCVQRAWSEYSSLAGNAEQVGHSLQGIEANSTILLYCTAFLNVFYSVVHALDRHIGSPVIFVN